MFTKFMFKKILATIGAISLMTACTSTPEVQTGADAEVIMGGLHKVDNSRADLAYVDPNTDFSKYHKIMLMPLGMDNVEIIQPNSSSSASRINRGNWELTDGDRENLQTIFHESMVKHLETKGGYEIVTGPGDDVLQVQAAILAIAPSAPKDDFRSRSAGRSQIYTQGAGSMAVMVAFADSETGEVLGLMKDSRASNSAAYWGGNNSVSNLSDVRIMFNSWATGIRKGLDNIHGK
jgi:hypothetical protein